MKCASAIPARNMVLLLHHGTCFNLRSTTEPLVYKKVQGVLRSQLQTANEDTETKNRAWFVKQNHVIVICCSYSPKYLTSLKSRVLQQSSRVKCVKKVKKFKMGHHSC
ncbi:uncharacterized protein [Phaseolus vulgaris]|uniref:uncharacterized protein isoform X1 n=1 Tax=Phaseolus vulgaris TaxID=3885 RepID=UPI0035CC0452